MSRCYAHSLWRTTAGANSESQQKNYEKIEKNTSKNISKIGLINADIEKHSKPKINNNSNNLMDSQPKRKIQKIEKNLEENNMKNNNYYLEIAVTSLAGSGRDLKRISDNSLKNQNNSENNLELNFNNSDMDFDDLEDLEVSLPINVGVIEDDLRPLSYLHRAHPRGRTTPAAPVHEQGGFNWRNRRGKYNLK